VDGIWEKCPWQIEITVPKRVRDIFSTGNPGRRATRSRIEVSESEVPTRDFSPQELDMEMTVVCAGDFLKEVFCELSLLTAVND
jgi:hypothetical protein